MTNVTTVTKMIELTGVLYFGCKRENQIGSNRSQPATIGRRELPVRWTLVEEIVRTVISTMPIEAITPAMGKERNPSRNVCGTGPMRSIGLFPMKARTELVPRININAMTGEAMMTERPMSRAGARVSPARMATYSNPLNAPTDSLLKILKQ